METNNPPLHRIRVTIRIKSQSNNSKNKNHQEYLDQFCNHDSFIDSPSHGLEYNLIGTFVLQVRNIIWCNISGTKHKMYCRKAEVSHKIIF